MKAGFISLGCSKNLVDTEHMMGILLAAGWEIVNEPADADAVIVNTCGFITDAKQEAIDTIIEMGLLKEQGRFQVLVAAGCMAQRYPQEMMDELPELDGLIGVNEYPEIPGILEMIMQGERLTRVTPDSWSAGYSLGVMPRLVSTGPGWAYLKVAEGCGNHCSYCAIPLIRGPLRSRPRHELVQEATAMIESGVKELVLVAQDLTAYGRDLSTGDNLLDLVQELSGLEGLRWIRLMYAYPQNRGRDLIPILQLPKVVPYLDIPIQHASGRVLRMMNRRYGHQQIADLIENIRREVPGITLRTTLMAGYPGETEQEHLENVNFLQEFEFDWVGVFAYSNEEGTVASGLSGELDPQVQQDRRDQLMTVQQGITRKKNLQRVHDRVDVLIEGEVQEGKYRGRASFQAPEVDGVVVVSSPVPLVAGEIIQVKLTGVSGYDLLGEVAIGIA